MLAILVPLSITMSWDTTTISIILWNTLSFTWSRYNGECWNSQTASWTEIVELVDLLKYRTLISYYSACSEDQLFCIRTEQLFSCPDVYSTMIIHIAYMVEHHNATKRHQNNNYFRVRTCTVRWLAIVSILHHNATTRQQKLLQYVYCCSCDCDCFVKLAAMFWGNILKKKMQDLLAHSSCSWCAF